MEAPDVVRQLEPLPDRPRIASGEVPWCHGVDVLRSIVDKGADICGTLKAFVRPTKKWISNTKDDKGSTYTWPVNAAAGAPSYLVSLLRRRKIRHAVEVKW